jgi:hypothetical protein
MMKFWKPKNLVSRNSWQWLEEAKKRIRAGEPEIIVMIDYGYMPIDYDLDKGKGVDCMTK